MIYTTYFAKLKTLPDNIIPIAICNKIPAWYSGLSYNKLAPKDNFFKQWKISGDNNYFITNYLQQILFKLNVQELVEELYTLANVHDNNKDIALVCYEKSTDFCHRHLVSAWLYNNGIACEEYK